MSGSHKEFPKKAVAVQLGLAALVGIGFLFADKPAAHAGAEKVTKPIVVAAANILAPIGKVEVKEESMASAARSGEEIYTSSCGVCHNSGAAGAPKLEDKASWETRLSGGFSALVASAIAGKGGMPARGGNPDITDPEMELVVGHMIKKAGIELVAKSANSASAKAVTSEAVAVKTETKPVAETIVEEVKTEVTEKVAVVKEVVVEKVEQAATKVEEVKEVITEKTSEIATKVEDIKTEAVAAVATVASTAAVVDHSAGEAIYKNSCFACHDSGVAGSPIIGDKAAWTSRIAAGSEIMYTSAIKGKGAMPAKGGNMSISDADIKAAVDYMAAKSM